MTQCAGSRGGRTVPGLGRGQPPASLLGGDSHIYPAGLETLPRCPPPRWNGRGPLWGTGAACGPVSTQLAGDRLQHCHPRSALPASLCHLTNRDPTCKAPPAIPGSAGAHPVSLAQGAHCVCWGGLLGPTRWHSELAPGCKGTRHTAARPRICPRDRVSCELHLSLVPHKYGGQRTIHTPHTLHTDVCSQGIQNPKQSLGSWSPGHGLGTSASLAPKGKQAG